MTDGLYVSVLFHEDTVAALWEMAQAMHVPNPLSPDNYHSTLIYSPDASDPSFVPLGVLEEPIVAVPSKFIVMRQQDGLLCLALEYTCQRIFDRHLEIVEGYNVIHPYESYVLHVTLSYNCGAAYAYNHRNPLDYVDRLLIVEECAEPLVRDWELK